jgi:hypothetical protein
LNKQNNFLCISYESLVGNLVESLKRISGFLGVDEFEDDFNLIPLKDQQGKLWHSNSTFESVGYISDNAIGRYKSILSEEVIKFIEAYCYPEMKLLGYKCDYISDDNYVENIINGLKEPFDIRRKYFHVDYSHSEENIYLEKSRISYLKSKKEITESEIKKFFINRETFLQLKSLL